MGSSDKKGEEETLNFGRVAHPFSRFTFVVPQFTAFPRESCHSTLLPVPAPGFAGAPSVAGFCEGWDGFGLRSESENLRQENFKLEI